MRVSAIVMTVLVGALLGLSTAAAQEGHPLKGSWLGTWGPSEDHTNAVIVVMDWDGEQITGTINPGTDDIAIENATLDTDDTAEWVLRFEAQGQSRSGETLNYVIEGTIGNLPFNNRYIEGTWTHQNGSGPFMVTRQ